MHLDLGPTAADDVQEWAKFARRVVCELRTDPGDLEGVATDDLLASWTQMIDRWEQNAETCDQTFRWSGDIDAEVAEYLLHGLERFLHSPDLQRRVNSDGQSAPSGFTKQVFQCFVDGLSTQGRCHQHYVDQVRASLGTALDH